MSTADIERNAAARLPDGDVVAVLLEQHARIRDLFREIARRTGDERQRAFDELRALLAVHEVAEELIVRPVARRTAGRREADARDDEEKQASKALQELERMDVSTADFLVALTDLEQMVGDHARHEEQEEFPVIVARCGDDHRLSMGRRLRRAERMAPTHPHPATAGSRPAQALTGPFATMVDRAKDAIGR